MDGFPTFKVSADGQTWTNYDAMFSWPGGSSQDLAFDSPVQARYIRFEVGPGSYYSGMYNTGIQFYQQ